MITTEIDTVIERPADAVFAYLSDFAKNPTWQNGMKSCVWITEPPHGVGSRYEQRAAFVGREINSTFEIIELDPGRLVKAATVSGTFPITFTRRVTALRPETTRVQALIEGDSSGFFRFVEPLMAPMVRRSIRADYRRLKDLLEAE
jgi:uncharacterized membrane protein